MRTPPTLLIPILLLAACSASAAAKKPARAPDPINTTGGVGYLAEQNNVIRKVDGKLVDLRPWFAWREAGRRASSLRQAYTTPNPLPGWMAVRASVQFVQGDGSVVLDRGSDGAAVLLNWPDAASKLTGSPVSEVARVTGTTNLKTVLGAGRTVPVFDFGQLATPEEIAALNQTTADLAAKAQAARDVEQKAKLEEAQRRVEKSRADRAAKEAKEKLEGK